MRGEILNYLKTLNDIIKYLESTLKEEIDEDYISKTFCLSYDMISRIFSILIGITPKKYIKLRRLSEAAKEISNSNKKIIDIALDYGYESVDAFSFAFKKYHLVTPSDVKNGASYNFFQPLTFQISVKGGSDMNVKIENKNSFTLLAYKSKYSLEELNDNNSYNKVYETFNNILYNNKIENKNIDVYGIYKKENDHISFYVGINYLDGKFKDLETLQIPPSKYAVFTAHGPVNTALNNAWQYIMGTFFAETDYKHSPSPDFEYYKAGNILDNNYETKIFIAIEEESYD